MKIKILAFVLLFTTFACQDDIYVEKERQDKVERIKTTSLENERHLINVLNQIGFSYTNKTVYSTARTASDGFQIVTDSILKVLQADSVNYTYTFKVDNDSIPNIFENLILKRVGGGYLAFILRYESENLTFNDLSTFNGKIKRFDLERNLLSEQYLSNGIFIKEDGTKGRSSSTSTSPQCLADVSLSLECAEEVFGGWDQATGASIMNCLEWVWVVEYSYESCPSSETGGGSNSGGTYFPDPDGGGGGSTGSGGSTPGDNPYNGPGSLGSSIEGADPIGVLPENPTKEEIEAWIEDLSDPELKRRAQLDYLRTHGARDFTDIVEGLLRTPEITVGEVWEINDLVNNVYLKQKAEFIIAIFNPETVGTILSLGIYSPVLSTPVRSTYFRLVARYAQNNVGKGFSSFDAFKRVYGKAGEGMDWHHIVEQRAANLTRFGAEKIHNTNNLIRIERTVHQQIINSYYAQSRPFTNGLTVREWLNIQTFEQQFEFGFRIVHNAIKGLPLP